MNQEKQNENAENQVDESVATAEANAETAKPKQSKKSEPTPEPGDFDWSIDKEGFGNYNESEKKEMSDFYEGTLKDITEKEIVKATVVSFNDKDVVLNIGFKSDGLVPLTEFRDIKNLKKGDVVDVLVESKEDALGQLVLSRKKAMAEKAWDKVVEALETGEIMEGYVKSRTKGGLVVDLMGIDTFLPGSQIDVKPIRDYDQYVGQDMQFKVVKINPVFKNVVVSHKALIEDDIEAQKSDILAKLEKGQVLEGVVKNMTSFGVFIDLGGLDGLLHITDISWGRINHPEEVLKLDEKLNVVVLDFDDEKKRISLGLKQLTSHPWDDLAKDLEVGSKVKGKVVTVADYGAFLEIAPGVEGLIHVSEMSWSQHLRSPQEFMKVGDEIEAVILTLDKEDRKMSLGIKQLTPDPWEKIAERYPVGSKHKGIVRNLTNYGLFVELEEGVDGLVHVSDLSWTKKIKHPAEFIKKDEELDVLVLEVDTENRRLSLGHKQLEENPWDTFETVFTIGSQHQGTVVNINEKGANVMLPYGVEGYCSIKNLKKEDKSNAKEEEVLPFVVVDFNKDAKKIVVSHSGVWRAEEESERAEAKAKAEGEKVAASKTAKKINAGTEKDTLGELDVLSALKAQMESSEKKATTKKAAPKAEKEESADEVKEEKTPAKKPAAKKATTTKKTTAKKVDEGDDATEEKAPAKKPAAKKPAAKKATKKDEDKDSE